MDTLPEELINYICSFVVDMPALCSLSRVSKQLHRIVEPHQYHTVYAKFQAPFDPEYSKAGVLLSTLRKYPHLQTYVKELQAECSAEYRSSIPEESITFLLCGPKCDQELHDIIALLPKLEVMHMFKFATGEPWAYSGPEWLDMIPSHSQRCQRCHVNCGLCGLHIPHDFTHLKRFDGGLDSSYLLDLHPLFALPNIEMLNFRRGKTYKLWGLTASLQRSNWKNMNSNVKELCFVDLFADTWGFDVPDDLKLIARCCPKLHDLEFLGQDRSYGIYFFRALICAFANTSVKNQLSRIEMGELWINTQPDAVCLDVYPLADAFRTAPLKDLELGSRILNDEWDDSIPIDNWPSRDLPRTLEVLEFDFVHPYLPHTDPCSSTRVVNGLEYFSNSNFRSKLPELKELTILCVTGQAWHEGDWMVRVKAKLEEQGVKFEIQEMGTMAETTAD